MKIADLIKREIDAAIRENQEAWNNVASLRDDITDEQTRRRLRAAAEDELAAAQALSDQSIAGYAKLLFSNSCRSPVQFILEGDKAILMTLSALSQDAENSRLFPVEKRQIRDEVFRFSHAFTSRCSVAGFQTETALSRIADLRKEGVLVRAYEDPKAQLRWLEVDMTKVFESVALDASLSGPTT